jgi:hypothetical protein
MSNKQGKSAFKSSGISNTPITLSVEPKKTVSFGKTSVPGTTINTSTEGVAERRQAFPGARSLFLDPNDEPNIERDGDPSELYLTEKDKKKLTEKTNNMVQNWLDPDSYKNLRVYANTGNLNKGEYATEGRVNIVRILNGKPVGSALTAADIKNTNDYEYRVRICNIGKACVTYVVAGAFLAKQLGILGGKGTRRSISKGTRRVKNRKHGKTRKNKSRKYIKK